MLSILFTFGLGLFHSLAGQGVLRRREAPALVQVKYPPRLKFMAVEQF